MWNEAQNNPLQNPQTDLFKMFHSATLFYYFHQSSVRLSKGACSSSTFCHPEKPVTPQKLSGGSSTLINKQHLMQRFYQRIHNCVWWNYCLSLLSLFCAFEDNILSIFSVFTTSKQKWHFCTYKLYRAGNIDLVRVSTMTWIFIVLTPYPDILITLIKYFLCVRE